MQIIMHVSMNFSPNIPVTVSRPAIAACTCRWCTINESTPISATYGPNHLDANDAYKQPKGMTTRCYQQAENTLPLVKTSANTKRELSHLNDRNRQKAADQVDEKTNPVIENKHKIWALVIGINAYRSFPLHGAAQDALNFRNYLMQHLRVPSRRIWTLLDENATRHAILEILYQFRDNSSIRPGDIIIVYFAGHGSSYDPQECFSSRSGMIGFVDVICPVDRGYDWESGLLVPDISLRELNLIFAEISDTGGSKIALILDCSHNVSTLSSNWDPPSYKVATTRTCEPLYESLRWMLHTADADKRRLSAKKALAEEWWPDNSSYVTFAACQDYESTREEYISERRTYRGQFTKALIDVLRLPNSLSMRFTEVAKRVAARMQTQTPFVSGREKNSRIWFPDPLDASIPCGKKKALLVACTYQHVRTNHPNVLPLKYSHKDPMNLWSLLLEHGYKDEDITVLVDVGDNKETYPTRVNIIKHIKELVNGAQAGDSFFIHFSGHGDQLVTDGDQFEVDGMDEFIYPCDYYELRQEGKEYYILDNLLRKLLVDPLPEGCRLFALFDCCSSGTVLDLPVNDNCEGDGASVVSATETEETLIGKPLIWKARASQSQTLQVDEPSGLIVGSTITEEPVEDCSAVYCQVNKPAPLNVLKLRRLARQEWRSWSLQPDPPSSAQGRGEVRLTSDQPSVIRPFSIVETVQTGQAGNQRSRTLPIYLYARRLQNRESIHLLPLMNPRGTESIGEDAMEDAMVPVDSSVVNADVLCIASCHDNSKTHETTRGDVLVQAFCTVVDSARRDGRDLTLKDLKCALRQRLQKIHSTSVENMMKEDPSMKVEDYETPVPQFSYSHAYDCSLIFTMF